MQKFLSTVIIVSLVLPPIALSGSAVAAENVSYPEMVQSNFDSVSVRVRGKDAKPSEVMGWDQFLASGYQPNAEYLLGFKNDAKEGFELGLSPKLSVVPNQIDYSVTAYLDGKAIYGEVAKVKSRPANRSEFIANQVELERVVKSVVEHVDSSHKVLISKNTEEKKGAQRKIAASVGKVICVAMLGAGVILFAASAKYMFSSGPSGGPQKFVNMLLVGGLGTVLAIGGVATCYLSD